MSDANQDREFREFVLRKVKESPEMAIAKVVSEFTQQAVTVTPIEIAEANMTQEQKDQLITAQIQLEKNGSVH